MLRERQMTPEESAALEDTKFAEVAATEFVAPEKPSALEVAASAPGDPNGIPDWVILPPNLKIPPGRQVGFMRFRASWTDTPNKGDRQLILWPLSDADEKLALKRTHGDSLRTIGEMAKQMIRAVDGTNADWSSGKFSVGSVEQFWNDIGARCRQQVQSYFLKTHALDDEERADFFLNCLAVRTSVAG